MKYTRWLALVLVLAVLLTGCSGLTFDQLLGDLNAQMATPFSEMTYTRPDMGKMEAALQDCCDAAQTSTSKDALIQKAWAFYDLYNTFYTQYNLASIYYYKDLTDAKWEKEYDYCLQNTSNADAMLEEMFYALADSPLKDQLEEDPAFGEGFFDGYAGDSVWDETFLSLLEQETALEKQYLDLCADAQSEEYYSDGHFEKYAPQMAQIYVDLIKTRQQIAEYAGYENYAAFAYESTYDRDYTPVQAERYLKEIENELVPLYRDADIWESFLTLGQSCSEEQAFAYTESCARDMGGTVENAFKLLKTAGLYDLTYSEKKHDISFEVFLTDYAVPYVFVNPSASQQDKLTFTHEFGHFCNDFATSGGITSIDVAEVFSQGLEYLSLCYGEGAGTLEQAKMLDCLKIYVDQAAYAMFEQKVYQLEGDELTVDNVFALYDEIGSAYGFDSLDWDNRDFVLVSHFFTDPMYIISYVVSNDAALQLYQMEKAEKGSGLALFEKELVTEQSCFLAFAEEAGLKSPFASGRLADVRKTLESVLK